jgi:hypothetical protein
MKKHFVAGFVLNVLEKTHGSGQLLYPRSCSVFKALKLSSSVISDDEGLVTILVISIVTFLTCGFENARMTLSLLF